MELAPPVSDERTSERDGAEESSRGMKKSRPEVQASKGARQSHLLPRPVRKRSSSNFRDGGTDESVKGPGRPAERSRRAGPKREVDLGESKAGAEERSSHLRILKVMDNQSHLVYPVLDGLLHEGGHWGAREAIGEGHRADRGTQETWRRWDRRRNLWWQF